MFILAKQFSKGKLFFCDLLTPKGAEWFHELHDGYTRFRARNLAIGALIEAVRGQSRSVDLKHINAVLVQPHWRKDYDTNPL